MARPRFSEMLVNRRRQLGLSTGQAARVLRFKEQELCDHRTCSRIVYLTTDKDYPVLEQP